MTRKHASRPPAAFQPVPVRPRADGWTPERQTGFIQALAASANVEAAAREVGMTTASVCTLRARPDATSFREAWDIALEYAVQRLGDAVLARAITGVATPIFYKGERVGERRRYDDQLAMFVLRMRDPGRFGSWRQGRVPLETAEYTAARLSAAVDRVTHVAVVTNMRGEAPDMAPLPELILITADQKKMLDALKLNEDLKREADGSRRESDAEVDPEGGCSAYFHNMLRLTLPIAALLAASPAPQAGTPRFDAIAFFSGRTEGTGRMKVMLRAGEAIRVEGRGRMDGETLVLDQAVTAGTKPPKPRQWRIREVAPGRYTGTLTDARGSITGTSTGNRLHLAFTTTGGFHVDQWLVLAPDGRSAQNRLTAKRFGLTVATLDETIRKLDDKETPS